MCDCKRKLQHLIDSHRLCNKRIKLENLPAPENYIVLNFSGAGSDNNNNNDNNISISNLYELRSIPSITEKEVVNEIVEEIVEEIKKISLQNEVVEVETTVPVVSSCDNMDIEEEDEIVELTDISPEELKQQEEEEKRMRDELALIELTKLTKKKVRSKK